MKKFDEINNYGVSNPDGNIKNVYESKITFKNEKTDFTKENNVSKLQEQKKVEERIIYKSERADNPNRGITGNIVAISNLLATSIVAVAGTVIMVAAVLTNAIINLCGLYACSCDSLTFYLNFDAQSQVSNSIIARLYNDDITNEMEINLEDPFLEFTELEPDTLYTLEIYDFDQESILYTDQFKTAPEENYTMGFEAWIEEGYISADDPGQEYQEGDTPQGNNLCVYTFTEEYEDITAFTISVFSSTGKELYLENVVRNIDEPLTGDSFQEDNYHMYDIGDEEFVYVSVYYVKDDYKIGRVQTIFKE